MLCLHLIPIMYVCKFVGSWCYLWKIRTNKEHHKHRPVLSVIAKYFLIYFLEEINNFQIVKEYYYCTANFMNLYLLSSAYLLFLANKLSCSANSQGTSKEVSFVFANKHSLKYSCSSSETLLFPSIWNITKDWLFFNASNNGW